MFAHASQANSYQVPASTKARKTSQNLHQHSRTAIPHLSNLQQVRKTVYSQIGPQAVGSHSRKKTATQQATNQYLAGAAGQDGGTAALLNVTSKSGGGLANCALMNQQADTTQNQSSLLTVPASPLSSRHTHLNVTANNATILASNNIQPMDDSTAMSAGHTTTTSTAVTGNQGPGATGTRARASSPQTANHSQYVTHDILLNTVKALVDYFEQKINDLANQKSMKTDLVANKENSVDILERIQHMLFMPLVQSTAEAVIQSQKNTGKHNNINGSSSRQQIKGQKSIGSNKENSNKAVAKAALADLDGQKHSTAKKINMMCIEDVEQLTIAQVPPNEIESAASAKAGHTSTRSLNPKNSRTKKNEKKSDTHFAKAPSAQPFKANNNVLNSHRQSTLSQSGYNKKGAGTKSGSHQGNQNHKRTSINSSRVSSTQNLFKPNPNFANTKRQLQQQHNAAAAAPTTNQQTPSQPAATATSLKRVASHDAGPISSSLAVKEQQHQQMCSVISGEVAGANDLDGDSGILPNISYRNHFQDIYSNSSLLKSIGRDEGDSADLNNFMTHQHQQLTEDNRNFTSAANDKRTPGLGVEASGKHKSSSQQRKNDSGGPFVLALHSNKNTASLSNVTSTFQIAKQEQEEVHDDEVLQCGAKTVFDQSQEIINHADVTPDKGQDNLLQLLSNLEGLTPAGLEHLMETQDKLASTTVVKRADSALTDLELHSRKQSDQYTQPHFASGMRRNSHQHHHHSQSRQQSNPRRTQAGSSTTRQALRFVDTSDQQSIPSPAPVVNYTQSHATLDPQSSRFIDAPALNTGRVTARDLISNQNVQKRLVYETQTNESGKQQQSNHQTTSAAHQRQAVTPRVSNGPQQPAQHHQSYNSNYMKPTGNTTRRHKSSKNGGGQASMATATANSGQQAHGHFQSTTLAPSQSKGHAGSNTLHSQRGAMSGNQALLNKPHSVLDQRRQTTNTGSTRNHANNLAGRHQQQYKSATATSTTNQSSKQQQAQLTHRSKQQQQLQLQPSSTSQLAASSNTVMSQQSDSLKKQSQQQQQKMLSLQAMKINENSNQQQSSTRPSAAMQMQQQMMMSPLNDHFMAKKQLIMPVASQATLTSRIQQQHEQLKAFETAATAGANSAGGGSVTSRTLSRTNSQSRYEDRFKQLTQLVERHQSQSLEQQLELQSSCVGNLMSQHRQFTEHARVFSHTAKTTPQVVDSKSTESTVVERETVFKIGIESEPLSSEECYEKGENDEENSVTKDHLHENRDSNRSYTSDEMAMKEAERLASPNNGGEMEEDDDELAQNIQENTADKASQGVESMGSLERQIQQIVLSRDLLHEMDIDLKQVVDMKNAGSVLEPSEEQTRGCMMLRQGLMENNQTSGVGMNTAQELEPSLPPGQLNLSADEEDQSHNQSPVQAQGAPFDPNTSNISFG